MPKQLSKKILMVFTGCLLLVEKPEMSLAKNIDEDVKELFETPLTEILRRQNITVTSVSKKAESLSDAAAAIYVITNEQIRQSGATSIPEALRLAPGLQVAQVGSNKWAITSRGFNDQLSNKLLVLIDGRSIYTPLFSGVNWDVQDTIIEDIERIEVVRGPAGTLWGANAVNGVINIITKSAKKTTDTFVSVLAGDQERINASFRQGGTVNDDLHFRVYGKYFDRKEFETTNNQEANDGWYSKRAGFRADWDASFDDRFTFQGEIYRTVEDRTLTQPTLTAPFSNTENIQEDLTGAHFISKWNHTHENFSESTLQIYYDYVKRDVPFFLTQARHTFDVDYQHSFELSESHDVIFGLGYRFNHDNLENSDYLIYNPNSRFDNLYSAFLQDTITIIPDTVFLTLGTKFEHNNYTGFEIQPNARASWIINEKNSAWASISRAVRTPDRSEDDISFFVGYIPDDALFPGSDDGFINQLGSRKYESEELIAYELGYRFLPTKKIFLDFAGFYNDYSNLRSLEGSLSADPDIALSLNIDNQGSAFSYGLEIAADYDAHKNWKLGATYTFFKLETDLKNGSSDTLLEGFEGASPKHQFTINSHLKLPKNFEIDNTLYFVDELESKNISSYLRFDTRIGWEVKRGLEFSLVGQNLLESSHQEFSNPLFSNATEVPRSFYAKVSYKF